MDEDELSSAEERGCTLSNVITVENIKSSFVSKTNNYMAYALPSTTSKNAGTKYNSFMQMPAFELRF